MKRRSFLAGVTAAGVLSAGRVLADMPSSLLDKARRLAATPYNPQRTPLPPPFAGLSYDAYRGIRPIPGRAAMLPLGKDFSVDLLPPGLFFPDPVRIDRDSGSGPQEIVFSTDLFSFQDRYFDTIPDSAPGAGFSGLRWGCPG